MIHPVGDVEMTLRINPAAVGALQTGLRGEPTVAIASPMSPGDRHHDAGLGIDTADRMVFRIHYDDVVPMVAADGFGRAPGSAEGRTAVAAIAALAGPGECGHDPPGIHLLHAVALALTDVRIALAVHANRAGAHDRRLRCRFPVPGSLFLTVAGEGGDDAGLQIQTSYSLVLNVRDEQSALAIQEAIVRLSQLCPGSRAAVAPVARFAGADDRGDDARAGIDLADSGVQPVDDVDVAVGIDLERIQVVQARGGCGAAVPRVALAPTSRDGRDDARPLVDSADGVVAPVGDVEITLRVEGAPVSFADPRQSGRASVARVPVLSRPDKRLDHAELEGHGRRLLSFMAGQLGSAARRAIITR